MPRGVGVMRGDPYWMSARFAGRCSQCKVPFEKGAQVFYYPVGRTVFFSSCAETASLDFQAHAADEAFATGGWS